MKHFFKSSFIFYIFFLPGVHLLKSAGSSTVTHIFLKVLIRVSSLSQKTLANLRKMFVDKVFFVDLF